MTSIAGGPCLEGSSNNELVAVARVLRMGAALGERKEGMGVVVCKGPTLPLSPWPRRALSMTGEAPYPPAKGGSPRSSRAVLSTVA
jgi:hypothetical protein